MQFILFFIATRINQQNHAWSALEKYVLFIFSKKGQTYHFKNFKACLEWILNLDTQIGAGSDLFSKYGSGSGQNTRILFHDPGMYCKAVSFQINFMHESTESTGQSTSKPKRYISGSNLREKKTGSISGPKQKQKEKRVRIVQF